MSVFLLPVREISWSRRGIALVCACILTMGLLVSAFTARMFQKERAAWNNGRWFGAGQMDTPLPEGGGLNLDLLRAAADQDPPPQGLNFGLGLYHMDRGEYGEAAQRFRREQSFFPDPHAIHAALDALFRGREEDGIDALARDPDYLEAMRGSYLMRVGFRRRDYGMTFRHLLISEAQTLQPSLLILALLSGGIWVVLFSHLFEQGRSRMLLPWVFAALVLGWASTWPTVISDLWMSERFGLRDSSEDFLTALLFHTVSVGFREEILKLLFFSPLLPVIFRKGDGRDALLLGAMTGLGFAIAENLGYLYRSPAGGVTTARFVSATFLHATLTGVTSLALYRAIRQPAQRLSESVVLLAMAMGLHGLYNALLSAPIDGLGDMSGFSVAALGGAAWLYFQELQTRTRRSRISMTAWFFWGYCLLILLELILTSVYLPYRGTVRSVGTTALGALTIAFVFLNQIREPLGD